MLNQIVRGNQSNKTAKHILPFARASTCVWPVSIVDTHKKTKKQYDETSIGLISRVVQATRYTLRWFSVISDVFNICNPNLIKMNLHSVN